ncbi:MAG: hypothetical protein ACFCU8_01910 [Thermosynechococcaceae cyanobacterium]
MLFKITAAIALAGAIALPSFAGSPVPNTPIYPQGPTSSTGHSSVDNTNEANAQANPYGSVQGTVVNQAIQNVTGYSKFGNGFVQCANDTLNAGTYGSTYGNFNTTFHVGVTKVLNGRNCTRYGGLQLNIAKGQYCDYLIDRYLGYKAQGLVVDWDKMVSNASYSIKESLACSLPFVEAQKPPPPVYQPPPPVYQPPKSLEPPEPLEALCYSGEDCPGSEKFESRDALERSQVQYYQNPTLGRFRFPD